MLIQEITSANAPKAIGPYTPAVKLGDFVYMSGQIPVDPASGEIVVSHYERFYQLLKPTHAHVLINGRIVMEGDETLVQKIDQDGYDWLYQQLDLQPAKEEVKLTFTLGSCAASARGRKHG